MPGHPELEAEQAHIDRAYTRVEELRASAEEVLRAALRGDGGGTRQAQVEREAMVEATLRRLNALRIGAASLVFGRIDTEDGDAFHIGRVAVADAEQNPLVVDWRAPVAEPFYRATGRHPLGLRRRRHFLTEGRSVLSIEDELFGDHGGDGDGLGGLSGVGGLGVPGSGALFAALDRARSGRMRDIVATIQREQDEIIRAPLPGILVVQGGPGTGKTAVALHRAAYLLYSHRFPLERQGLLVVGPNRLFLRYIEQVLPSLGETGVELSTLSALVGGIEPSGADRRGVARLKGDARMAAVLVRALADRQRPLPRDTRVPVGTVSARLTRAASAKIVAEAKRRPGPHNGRRRHVERLVFEQLRASYDEAIERERRAGLRVEGALASDQLADELRAHPAVRAALDRMWPVLTAEELLHDLLGAAPLLASACRGILSTEEQASLARPRGTDVATVAWTAADLALLDEARALVGPAGRRSTLVGGDEADWPRTYGHIVVDEAQDLSPMQLRLVARRAPSSSMTLVGDLAQATGPQAPATWRDVLTHLPAGRESRVVELTVNYRTPAELMEVADRVLVAALPGARPPTSIRTTGIAPLTVAAGSNGRGLVATVIEMVQRELDAGDRGALAVICAPSAVGELTDGLEAALVGTGIDVGTAGRRGLDAPVTVVPMTLVKGLEFDVAVVVEPGAIIDEADQGLRALYVALTRATRRLVLVHAEPLPEVLRLGPGR